MVSQGIVGCLLRLVQGALSTSRVPKVLEGCAPHQLRCLLPFPTGRTRGSLLAGGPFFL